MRSVKKILTLGAVFAAGCLFSALFSPFEHLSTVQYRAGEDNQPLPVYTDTKETSSPQPSHPPHPPAVFPAHLKEKLPKANFSKDRKEHASLDFIRKHGLVSNLPDEQAIGEMDIVKINAILHSYLDNTDIICQRRLRMGKIMDGGWEVCDDYQWRPIPPCLVYSFGINYDFSFDDDIGKVYGCDVYSFDPSMNKSSTSQRSGRVAFYKYGIGGRSGSPPEKTSRGWILHSLSNLKALLKHTNKVLDVVKLDVEFAEWEALHTMIREHQLHQVRQLLLEFHIRKELAQVRSYLQVLAALEQIGFRKFYAHKNGRINGMGVRKVDPFPVARVYLYEVHYVNVNFQRRSLRAG